MANNNDKMIFGIGFDLATGIKEVEGQIPSAIKKLQKVVDKHPLKVKLEIKKGMLNDLKDYVQVVREISAAKKGLNEANISEAKARKENANAIAAENKAQQAILKTKRDEATQNARITKTIHDAKVAQQRWTEVKKNGYRTTMGMNGALNLQSSYLGRLATRLAAYASIHQVMAFVSGIRQVTAEFELQRVALGALLEDSYKANTIFEQIKMQAVKSPYEVKDLVSYTKQLAAYGVEADELMSTMNSLADISAGLGTDMNRIILAYGQIQAAGVLKGTELRQLTELGLPMVDLLAQYYSTLRNEVITTSQVFEMISKKEIPFEAVKEILQDLTEEGGRFFEMQKTQSETLYGQWTNMKDALHIMMDEIGRTEEVQDIFRSLIDSVHWLTNNWERLFKTVRNFLFIYGSLKSVTLVTQLYAISLSRLAVGAQRWAKISSLFSAINLRNAATTIRSTAANIKHIFSLQALKSAAKKAALGIKTLSISLAKLMLANPTGWIMAIVSALMLLDFSMKKSTSATDKFLQKQKELVQGASANVKNLEAEFKRLANIVVTSEDNSNEQNKALRKLKDQFGDMIPEYQLTSEYLRKLKDDTDNLTSGFDNLTGSIRQYAANQLIETLKENVKIKAQEIFSDMYGSLAGTAWTSWINTGLQIIESDDSANEIRAAMLRLYGKVYTTDVFPYKRPDGTFTNMPIPEEGYGLSRDEFAKFMNALEAKNAQAHKFFSFLLKTWELETMSANIAKDAHWLDTSSARIKRMEKELERINNEIGGNSLKEADESKQSLRTEYFITQLEKLRKEAGLSEQVTNDVIDSIQRLKAEIREKPKGEQTPEMTSLYKDLNEMLNLYGYYDDAWRAKLVGLQRYIFDDTQKISAYAIDQINQFVNLSDALEGAAKDYKELKEQKERLEKTLASPSLEPDTEDKEKKRLEKTQTRMELLYEFLKMYNALDLLEDKKKGANPKIKQLEDELATVEKIYKKYQDFRKYMGDEEARAKTKEYFKDVEFQWLKMAFTPEEFKTQANEALRIVKTFAGDTKKVQQNIQFKIGDVDFDEEKVLIEKEMKRLSDQLSRTKTAKEFFDNMLGLTGDKQLSATLTMSVYGVTQDANLGSELGKSIAKQMQDQVQTYFGDVDISSAINKATSEIDPIGLEKLLTEENIAKIGEKDVENIRKIISDLISSDAKFWEEMMKDLGKTQTYGDKLVKVYETLQSRIEKIRSREDLDETTKASLIDQVKANAEKEMSKLQYEAFKDSPLYVAMFEKLDATSTTMLTNMRNHLEALRGEWANSLDPSQLKELQKRINEIDKQLVSRNPFKGIIDGFKEFNALSETRSRKDDESEAFDATKKRLEAEKAYQRAVSEGKPSDEIARLAEELDKCVDAEDKATEKMREWDDATQKVLQSVQELKDFTQLIQNATTAVTNIAEAFGGWGNSADEEFWNTMLDSINKFVGGVESAALGVGKIMAGDIIGGAASLASGIGSIVSSIGNWMYAGRIRNAERDIDRLQDSLDSLAYSYGRLEKAQEKAFGTEYIQKYSDMLANLEAQQVAYLEQANAERSKGKKADEGKIKDYETQARDTADAIKDMYGSLSEHFLGQDLSSAARDFAQAWIDAYKEFANTSDAMKEKFQDMIQNMVVESLLAKVMERALKPVFDAIDEMQDTDFYSPSFWDNIMSTMQVATENGVVGAQNVMTMLEQMGINLRGLGGNMTGISRDIASASEEPIFGLAAGINTQNFYISQVPTKLDTIIALMRGEGAMPQGSTITLQDVMIAQNQYLMHLPTIAQHTAETVAECKAIVVETRRTADALDRVIKPKGTQTTYTMNTTLGS